MPSSTSNSDHSDRTVPALPWTRFATIASLLAVGATLGWELHCRARGYAPTLNDTSDLWAERREAVRPDSLVIVGDSRPLFDLDLDVIEEGLGRRPIQLALPGSCGYPVLADLANDEHFKGTVICSIVPALFFAPPGTPPVLTSQKALRRFHTWSPAQRSSHYLTIPLEHHLAFLRQEDLTLEQLLLDLPISNRSSALIPPRLPPYFQSMDRERRTRMTDKAATPGELQTRIQQTWLPLFTPPPPPTFIPTDVFMGEIGKAIETRFKDTLAAVAKIRARGGKVVFVRFPFNGELQALEDRLTPRAKTWDPLIKASGAPGIHFQDHAELSSFICPEWSHLSAGDSVEFTKRLVPHLRTALEL